MDLCSKKTILSKKVTAGHTKNTFKMRPKKSPWWAQIK